jgi:hypothetical protein
MLGRGHTLIALKALEKRKLTSVKMDFIYFGFEGVRLGLVVTLSLHKVNEKALDKSKLSSIKMDLIYMYFWFEGS